MFRLLVLPILLLAAAVGVAARLGRGRGALRWGVAALTAQLALAVLAIGAAGAESPDVGAETWVIALALLAPAAGAGLVLGLLWLLPRR